MTAGTVVVGAFVILFDPIFEGLAISLMFGALASTGRHLGTRAFPGTVSLLFTVGSEESMAALSEDLREFAARCRPGQGLRVFALAASQVV